MFQMLAQEPWCFHPEQIATLTDWQIEHLYARPAVERANEAKRRAEGRGESPHHREAHPAPGTPQFKSWVVNQFLKSGMSLDQAIKKYDQQARSKQR